MGEEGAKVRLGRGLAALIGDVDEDAAAPAERSRGQRRVAIEFLRPNPRNPRKHFAEADLQELSDSIRQRGIVQPIVVRALPGVPDAFEIVAGERRWRAAQRAGLHEVPVAVVEVDDRTSLEYAILENVQRSDLNAVEEAAGYERLMREFDYNQAELAQILGKSRSHLANTLRLLNLPPNIQSMVGRGELTAGHARALLGLKDPEAVARRITERGLSVRDVERIAQGEQRSADSHKGETAVGSRRKAADDKDPDTRALEKAIEDVIGLHVAIEHGARGGEIRIRYATLEQLDGLCRRLRNAGPAL
jgi:ParB family chromosome partitioning protein